MIYSQKKTPTATHQTTHAYCHNIKVTPLIVPPGTIKNITSIERAFLWSGTDKTTGNKCKVSWEKVCRPKELGGLGVLHIGKFARALRLRWAWLEWKEPGRIWVGTGSPCTADDMEFFYAATSITIGNGHKTPFWDAPWLGGRIDRKSTRLNSSHPV